jgi:predicted metal-binding membrane protein
MEGSHTSLVREQRVVLLACAGAVTLAAWIWLAGASLSMMPAHAHHPMGWRAFASLVAMWEAMMVAMMTPAALDWLLTFASLTGRTGGASRGSRSALAFAGGYFLVWLGYSVVAAALQMVLAHSGWLNGGRLPSRAGGAVLIAAGLVYFTPLARACLSHCRNPLTYFLSRWTGGPRGGFGFGIAHGAYCVGCCWMLMITGFAVGVMNILWMVCLTLLICAEKLAPHGQRIGGIAAAGMTIWGLMLLF